jgi:sulfur carrier protein ThiS
MTKKEFGLHIHVTYRGFASIAEIDRDAVVKMPEGSTISDLYLRLGLTEDLHSNLQAFVNNDAAWRSTILRDRDRVVLATPLSGG